MCKKGPRLTLWVEALPVHRRHGVREGATAQAATTRQVRRYALARCGAHARALAPCAPLSHRAHTTAAGAPPAVFPAVCPTQDAGGDAAVACPTPATRSQRSRG